MKPVPEHIDQLFRERLQDATPQPPAFVWENIEQELQKKRRRFFFWLFGFGAIGLGLMGLWFAQHEQATADLKTEQTLNPENTIVPQVQMADQPASLVATEKKQVTNIEIVQHKDISTKRPKDATFLPDPINLTPKGSTATPGAVKAILASSHGPNKTHPVALEAKPQKATLNILSTEKPVENMASLPKASPSAVSRTTLLLPSSKIFQTALEKTLSQRIAKPRTKKPVKSCYDFSKQPKAWMFDVYAGPSLAQRELITSPDNKPYLNARLSAEKPYFAFNTGLRASLMLNGNFLLRTGLNYDQITETFVHVDPEFVRTTIVKTEHSNGTITYDTIIEYGEHYQKIFNRFGMLDIPLTAGFEFRKGRSGFNINAGMTLNLLFWKRGAIPSPDTDDLMWFSPGKPGATEVFRSSAGLSATASVQWFYHVNPRLRLFVEPSFKRVLRPLTLNSHPVEQRYSIGALRLGFTKILN